VKPGTARKNANATHVPVASVTARQQAKRGTRSGAGARAVAACCSCYWERCDAQCPGAALPGPVSGLTICAVDQLNLVVPFHRPSLSWPHVPAVKTKQKGTYQLQRINKKQRSEASTSGGSRKETYSHRSSRAGSTSVTATAANHAHSRHLKH
jgi:hypothetical protein